MNYEKELMILVGPIGSGKTTFAKTLQNDTSLRISQDEMGRKAYLTHFKDAVKTGIPRIIIDRMNFNKEQRNRFIEPAKEAGYCVTIFEIDHCPAQCLQRVIQRTGHPTIENNNSELAQRILNKYYSEYEHPEENEYDNYNLVGVNE